MRFVDALHSVGYPVVAEGMKQKFSQFSVGELEAGARKRQGLAEARRHAQVRDRIARSCFCPTADMFQKTKYRHTQQVGGCWLCCFSALPFVSSVLGPFLSTPGVANVPNIDHQICLCFAGAAGKTSLLNHPGRAFEHDCTTSQASTILNAVYGWRHRERENIAQQHTYVGKGDIHADDSISSGNVTLNP